MNVTTLAVYSALGGTLFLLVLQLQDTLGYSALAAGPATLPVTVLMLLLSSRMGGLAQRIGARLPMTIGPLVAGIGVALLSFVRPGVSFADGVLPGVTVFGLGPTITVAPLTTTLLASVDAEHVGAASGANNAVSRLANLLAVAVLPLASGMEAGGGGVARGYGTAMLISAVVCALGGLSSWLTVR